MRLRVDHPALLPDLIAFLAEQLDMVAEVRTPTELEFSLLGSYGIASAREAVALVVAAWEEADPERRGTVTVIA
jgi:hypothetical protein